MFIARTQPRTCTPSSRRRRRAFRSEFVLAALLGLVCSLAPAAAAGADATVPPSVLGNPYTYSVIGGTTFGVVVNVQVLNGPEAQPVTVTVTHDTSDPVDFPPLLTFLDVPAQADPHWDCSATNLATQVVSCTYTPTPGSPVQPNTLISLTIDGTAPIGARDYPTLTDALVSSPDNSTPLPSEPTTIIDVVPPPTISNLGATPSITTLGHGTTLTATASDNSNDTTYIASADYSINGGPWTPMAASDGSFDSVTENVTATITAPPSPVADTICVRATESNTNASDGTACTSFVVYDPSAGFVTGGGWITSPVGACQNLALCTNAQGKGTFGFVSKYQKGATVPSGNTQYVFHEGNFNFASSSYQWLVVNQGGTNAQFKGTGTINGTGSYQFMIWATQGSPNTFRIQVTDPVSGNTVYDSGPQALGGGSIIVHKS